MILLWLIFGLIGVFVFVPVARSLSTKLGVVDHPTNEEKKLHNVSTPLMGGLAIYATLFIFLVITLSTTDLLEVGLIQAHHYVGFLIGGGILMIGGFLDDKYDLSPKIAIIFPLIAALIAVLFGIGVSKLTNPFGGILEISHLASGILTFVWLMVVMYTTKFLDGVDGLASGVSGAGALMIALLTLTTAFYQPDVAIVALLVFGALVGFLILNLRPGYIFLGDGGSLFVGYTLGVLAVIGGAKLGTALLVLIIPFLDVIWVVFRRILVDKKSPTIGDAKHLHHRLRRIGLSDRQVLVFYLSIAVIVGLITLFLQSQEKLMLFAVLIILMVLFALFIVQKERKKL